jgi:Rrf2 family iron-sulfur cluster assembly transcriptional regulator
MSLLFSRKCEYAIRSVIYLLRNKEAVSVKNLASELKIPRAFTGKILQELHHGGILRSYPGSKGGYTLSRSPESIRLIDVVMIIDGEPVQHQCILGQPDCSDANPCPLHGWWSGISHSINDQLHKPLTEYAV